MTQSLYYIHLNSWQPSVRLHQIVNLQIYLEFEIFREPPTILLRKYCTVIVILDAFAPVHVFQLLSYYSVIVPHHWYGWFVYYQSVFIKSRPRFYRFVIALFSPICTNLKVASHEVLSYLSYLNRIHAKPFSLYLFVFSLLISFFCCHLQSLAILWCNALRICPNS